MKTKLLLSALTLVTVRTYAQNPLFLSQATNGGTASVSQVISTKTGKTFYNTVDYSNHWSQAWGLHVTDGTQPGTQKLTLQTTQFITTEATMLTPFGDKKILFAGDNTQGYGEVWVSDGTQEGTFGIQNFFPQTPITWPPVTGIAAIGDLGVYAGFSWDSHLKLHITTGSAYGDSAVIYDFGLHGAPYDGAFHFETVNNLIYFVMNNTVTKHTEMWRTDGTAAGTVLLKDFDFGYSPGNNYMNFKGNLYFTVISTAEGDYLWKTDGTAAGTTRIKQISTTRQIDNLFTFNAAIENSLVTANNALYFAATDGVHGKELWRTDGTEAGTYMTFDFNPGSASSNPMSLAVLNGLLYFSATTSIFNVGTELYSYNGQQYSQPIDINPGPDGSNPAGFTVINNTIIFSATNAANGRELWVTDGTAIHTVQLADIDKADIGSQPFAFAVQNNSKAFFAGKYDINGDGRSDEQCVFTYKAPKLIWTGSHSSTTDDPNNWMPAGTSTGTDDILIPVNPLNAMDIGVLFANNFYNNGATVNTNTGMAFIYNDLFNSGTINNTNNGIFALVRNDSGNVRNIGSPGSFNGQLTMSSGINARLADNIKVDALRVEGADSIYLGDYSFTVNSYPMFTPFMITDGNGKLTMQVGSTPVVFPLMSGSKSYTPLIIANSGTTDYFSVGIKDGVYSDGYDAGSGVLITQEAVNKTWMIEEAVAGGSNVTITAQWNAADELPMFNRTNVYLSHYMNNAWDYGSGGLASGGGPFTYTRSGITSFSPFAITSSATILPLNLFNFSARNNNNMIQLNWQTQNEVNTANFNVQRSTDGLHFNNIGSLKAAGNSAVVNSYNYNDNDAAKLNSAKLYYRIQTMDKDNTSSMSKMVAVELIGENRIAVWPNPVKDALTVKVTGDNGSAIIYVYDMSGRPVLSTTRNIASGIITLNTASLKAGSYLIRINVNGDVLKQSFIKQ